MSKLSFKNVNLEPLPGGDWKITDASPMQTPEPIAPPTPAKPIIQEPAGIKRENAKLDPDLIRAYKVLAAKQGRFVYEVMEDALKAYLKK